MGNLSWRAIRHVSRLSVGERRDLLRDLTAPSIIRADAIRQFRERPDGQRMAEVLMDLEADETLRLHVVDRADDLLETRGKRRDDPALTKCDGRAPADPAKPLIEGVQDDDDDPAGARRPCVCGAVCE